MPISCISFGLAMARTPLGTRAQRCVDANTRRQSPNTLVDRTLSMLLAVPLCMARTVANEVDREDVSAAQGVEK